MFKKNRKIRQNFSYGGNRQYRRPSIFAGKRTTESKEIKVPKYVWKIAFYSVLLIIAVYYFLFSRTFAIKDVMVEGNNLVPSEKISSYIPNGGNIFRFDLSKTKKEILFDNQELSSIEIFRGIPDAIKIIVAEHENKLVWQTGQDFYLVSTQGKVTKKITPEQAGTLPKVVDSKNFPVELGTTIVSPSFIAFIYNINDKFFDTVNIKPTNFEVLDTTFDVNLHTEAGFYVKFNSMRSSQKQLDDLKKVLVAKRDGIHEYVDLRIDGWAYYK